MDSPLAPIVYCDSDFPRLHAIERNPCGAFIIDYQLKSRIMHCSVLGSRGIFIRRVISSRLLGTRMGMGPLPRWFWEMKIASSLELFRGTGQAVIGGEMDGVVHYQSSSKPTQPPPAPFSYHLMLVFIPFYLAEQFPVTVHPCNPPLPHDSSTFDGLPCNWISEI